VDSLVRHCLRCEQEFVLESLRSWRKAYCSFDCRESARKHRQNVKRRGELSVIACVGCGTDFMPKNTRQISCKPRCSSVVSEKKRKRRHKIANETRTCLHCSGVIESNRNRNAIYCSKCAKPESRRVANCQDCGASLPPRKRSFCPECHENTKYARNRASQYNISLAEYRGLMAKGKCDICSVELKERMPSWNRYSEVGHIDHDHETGKVRGYLCRYCNHMIGNAKDDVVRLQLAIKYLTQFAYRREQ